MHLSSREQTADGTVAPTAHGSASRAIRAYQLHFLRIYAEKGQKGSRNPRQPAVKPR